MTDPTFPPQFAALNEHLRWALPTTKERLRARAGSTMPTLQAFYDALAPQMEGILTYLQDFPADESALEPPVRRLVHLAKAFMDVSIAIEVFNEPDESGVWGFEMLDMELKP